jgi:hypothetical protein
MIFNLAKSKKCPSFGKPKGKLDTQLYPECAGTKYDRDIVKKTREERKKKSSSDNLHKKAGSDMGAALIKYELNGKTDVHMMSCSLTRDDKSSILEHFKSFFPEANVLDVKIVPDDQRPTGPELDSWTKASCSSGKCGISKESTEDTDKTSANWYKFVK